MPETIPSRQINRIKVTPVFYANKRAYDSKKYRVIANQGSTRSSKTYSVVQLLITIAMQEPDMGISICSPSLVHLKKGARKDFLDIMEAWHLFKEDDFNRTDNVYRFPKTKSYIEFFGADEPGRLRGPGRKILFLNEANLLGYESYIQLSIRTTGTIFIDFNPADEVSWVYTVADAEGNKLIVSTYGNNRSNLSAAQIQEIEGLKNIDENLWNVYGRGMRGTSSETIYTHWKLCNELPLRGELFMGLDFGYNVPTALDLIEDWEGGSYVDEWLYEPKLTTSDLIGRMDGLEVSKTIEIFCDNAEPKTIEEICRAGYNAMPADKDVTEGIRKVRGRPLWITKRSTNTIKEIKSYKWKKDRDLNVLDEPVKHMDHSMDAMRYGIFTKLSIDGYTWGALS